MTTNNNKHLWHRIVGNGYPIVFLHGFLERSTMWNYLDLQIKKELQFIFIDLPGHGKSKHLSATSVKEMALNVKAVLDLNNINNYALIGHSLGGYVGLELLATVCPPRRLILYSSHPFEDTPTRKQNRNRLIQLVETKKEHFLEEAIPNLFFSPKNSVNAIKSLINEAKEMDFELIQDASIAMRDRPDYRMICSKSNCKISYIGGKQDLLIDQKKLNRWINDTRIDAHIIDHTAHMAHIEQSAALKKQMNLFFESILQNKKTGI